MKENVLGVRRTADAMPAHDVAVAREAGGQPESARSAVSWAAIIAGAFAAVTTAVILMALGAGLGLTTVSAEPNSGASAMTFGVVAAIWIVVVQWLSAAFGGYVAGRLRTKWTGLHTDEVFFRDTAHGFLAWATATLIVVAVAGSAGTSVLRGAASAAASATSGIAQVAGQAAQRPAAQQGGGAADTSPIVGGLFRSNNPSGLSDQDARASALAIMGNAARNGGDLSQDDRTYLAQLISAKTGLSQGDAQQRVDSAYAQMKDAEAKARQAAETARKTAASISIITALSLLIGAFVAGVAGAVGGRLRDEY